MDNSLLWFNLGLHTACMIVLLFLLYRLVELVRELIDWLKKND
jgi:hypothetical protein